MDGMDELDNLDKKIVLTPLRRYKPHEHWRKR